MSTHNIFLWRNKKNIMWITLFSGAVYTTENYLYISGEMLKVVDPSSLVWLDDKVEQYRDNFDFLSKYLYEE